jgi:hypothetical protein
MVPGAAQPSIVATGPAERSAPAPEAATGRVPSTGGFAATEDRPQAPPQRAPRAVASSALPPGYGLPALGHPLPDRPARLATAATVDGAGRRAPARSAGRAATAVGATTAAAATTPGGATNGSGAGARGRVRASGGEPGTPGGTAPARPVPDRAITPAVPVVRERPSRDHLWPDARPRSAGARTFSGMSPAGGRIQPAEVVVGENAAAAGRAAPAAGRAPAWARQPEVAGGRPDAAGREPRSPRPAPPQIDVDRLTETVHARFVQRLAVERERRGRSR